MNSFVTRKIPIKSLNVVLLWALSIEFIMILWTQHKLYWGALNGVRNVKAKIQTKRKKSNKNLSKYWIKLAQMSFETTKNWITTNPSWTNRIKSKWLFYWEITISNNFFTLWKHRNIYLHNILNTLLDPMEWKENNKKSKEFGFVCTHWIISEHKHSSQKP